jgi:hypothetical protein
MSRDCGHLLGGGTWLLYDETPIKAEVTKSEGMVSLLLGQDEQLRLDFLDADPLDRLVCAAIEARRLFGEIEHYPRRQS